jgi:carboxypeptidase C (cathepsin A)
MISKRECIFGAAAIALAAQAGPASAQAPAAGPFVTRHRGTFGATTVDYVATVSETILAKDGAPALSLVSTAYTRADADPRTRPVVFIFNGGPSVASSILHMYALGPKRIVVEQDPALPPAEPAQLIDNTYSILDAADLVFIDPAETGFSRVLPGGNRADYYNVIGDARSISDFAIAWSRENGRDNAPKYVLGESYGTLRATMMAGQLAETMPLDGVFLFGQAVNMIETSQRAKNAIAYATNLPALVAIAAYHRRINTRGRSMSQLIDAAYQWGMNEYLLALTRGRDLPIRQQRRIASELEAMTGISAAYYLEHQLAITKVDFATEFFRAEGRVLGTYDARYTAPTGAPEPSTRVLAPAATMAAQHLTRTLGVRRPAADYRSGAPDTIANWNWSRTAGIGGPFDDYNYQAQLSRAFAANPRFRLMIGTGIYDLTTTVGPARYLVAKSDYPAERVTLRQYEGGHAAYTNEPALRAFSDDVRTWVTGGLPR